MRALILDPCGARAALAGARALAAAGWHVGIAAPGADGLAAASRCVRARHALAAPGDGGERFAATLERTIRHGSYDIVFASTDGDLLALSAVREQLSAVVPHPPHATLLRALDKAELATAARRVGVAVPRSAPTSALESLGSPLIVKERLHGDPRAGTQTAAVEAELVACADDALDRVRALRARGRGSDALVQEVIRGRLIALIVVCDRDGHPVARVQQEALRTWPGDVGRSVRARTVAIDEELADGAARLLGELGWFGLAQLQFIAPADGPPRLIDLNARFYGSLALALAAGVNLPATWAALALGRPADRADAVPGARYHWLESDLRRARQERRGRGAWTAALGCLTWACGTRQFVRAASDPRPGARAIAVAARRSLR